MRLSDKQIGVLSLLALVLVGLWIAGQMVWKSHKASSRVIVMFEEMGSLQPQDPVTSRGFPVGRVGTVIWLDGMARVELLLDEPMLLREETLIRNENYSLMGQRRIEILPKHEGPVVDSDHVFIGEFEPGIAEGMHLMSQIKEQVVAIRDLVFLLRYGDSTTHSIPQITENVLSKSEVTIEQLEKTMAIARPVLNKTIHQVESLSDQAIVITKQTDTTLRTIHTQGTLTIAETKKLLDATQKSMEGLILFMDQLESQPLTQQLLYKQDLVKKVDSFVESMQAILKLFDKNGLVILDEQGKPRGLSGISNVNLFGKTARQKATLRPNDE